MQEGRNQDDADWTYVPEASEASIIHDNQDSVSWSASEYIGGQKNVSWFLMLAACTVGVGLIAYLFTKDKMTLVIIGVLAIAVGVFAARQPHVLNYSIDGRGLLIAHKLYPYEIFKSFSVVQAGPFNYISLLPLKRFMPPLSIHYSPDDEEKIITTLADYLPYEEHKRDLVENFSRRIRF